MLPENCRQIYSYEQISEALDRLADKLNPQLQDENPLVLTVMQGGLIFAGQLIPKLDCMLDIDYIHATRYNNGTRGSSIEWKAHPASSLENRTVLILDDILDEGETLKAIVHYCEDRGAEKVLSAVLLKKMHHRCVDDKLTDKIALTVEDKYVFGFGMDYNGRYRHIDGVYAVDDE